MSLIFRQIEARRVYADNKLSNAATDASLRLTYETRGYGERKVAKPIVFGITFLERPTFASGLTVADRTLVDGSFPMGAVMVWDWHLSSRGHWIGAYVAFNVFTGTAHGRLQWDMTFSGEALRAVQGDEDA